FKSRVRGTMIAQAKRFTAGTIFLAFLFVSTPSSAEPSNSSGGVIEGKLSYPSDFIPAMTVCAQSISNYQQLTCIRTKEGQRTFKLSVKPGENFVFSQVKGSFTDGATGRVYDAFFYHAKGRTPIPVRVSAGKTISGVSLNNQRICHYGLPAAAYCVTPSAN
ncbi:MAG: hypothetical protein WCA07_01920, partial [Gloeobacterales cyanobacterium]